MLQTGGAKLCSRSPKESWKGGQRRKDVIFPHAKHLETPPLTSILTNGARISVEERSIGDAAIVVVFPFGLTDDQYASHMIEHLLFRCPTKKEADADVQIERLGGFFTGYTQADLMCLQMIVSAENAENAIRLLYRCLTSNELSKRHLDTEKKVIIGECRGRRQLLTYALDDARETHLLGGHSLYVPRELESGTHDLTVEGILECKSKYVGGRGLNIGIVGPNAKRLMEFAEETFSLLKNNGPKIKTFRKRKVNGDNERIKHIYIATHPECTLSIGGTLGGYGSKDLYAAEMTAQILVGLGSSYEARSRLWRRIRARNGGMYQAEVSLEPYSGISLLEIQADGILQERERLIRTMFLEEIADIASNMPPEREFSEARDALLKMERRRLQEESLEDAAERLALSSFYGISPRYGPYERAIKQLAPEDVQKLVKKCFIDGNPFVGVVKK